MNIYNLLDVLFCSIAVDFYELCHKNNRQTTSKILSDTTQQNV